MKSKLQAAQRRVVVEQSFSMMISTGFAHKIMKIAPVYMSPTRHKLLYCAQFAENKQHEVGANAEEEGH